MSGVGSNFTAHLLLETYTLIMKQFRTKFNYLVFAFLILMSFLLTAPLIYFIFRLAHLAVNESMTHSLKIFFGGLVIFGYPFLMFWHLTLLIRYSLVIANNRILLKENLFFQTSDITDIIEGYSKTEFGQLQRSQNTLILYLETGKKINLPKFMSRNFKEIEQELINNNVPFLGNEPFKWKNIIQRAYQYS